MNLEGLPYSLEQNMADSNESERHGKTLFVRNLPYSATNDSLEKVFSEIGPLRSCFVVKDQDSGKCRGFGYAKFALLEDAEKALAAVKKIEGRNVHIVFANKKEKKKRFGVPKKRDESGTEESLETTDVQRIVHVQGKENQDGEQQETDKRVPNQKRSKKKKEGKPTPVKGQKQAPNPLNEGKRARLIVRNLAFRCTNEELKAAFEKCGTVVDVHIPKKASGTRLGFGFVQFENKAQAGMAVAQLNGISVAGRQVAVDWSLPKNLYESRVQVSQSESQKETAEAESMEVDEESEAREKSSSKKSSNMDVDIKVEPSEPSDEEDDEDEEEEEEEDETDEEEEEESSDGGSIADNNNKHKKDLDVKPTRPSDVGEGRTIFIRNMPFAVGEEEVVECFSDFGEVKYARIVKDRNTGMSRGTGFVQFTSKEAAEASLEAGASENTGGISLQGRQLIVSLAVSREQAGVLTHQKEEEKKKKRQDGAEKNEKDSRNLYLAREGMIRSGTEAAKDVPASDLALRAKIAETNRVKLKDQNVFVSSTRLCIHNIPPTVEDSKLRKLVLKAVQDKDARITECRIMRDLARVNSKGQGKSKGFAFVSFSQHTHALAALKKLNNCPNVFGDKKRPIVEFSLENRKALEAKQKRLEKSLANQTKPKTKANGAVKQQGQATGGEEHAQTGRKKQRKNNTKKKIRQDALPLEAKKQQDKVARSLYKGPLGLPSHSGPKQRHKPRPGQQDLSKKGSLQKGGKGNKNLKQSQRKTREPQVKSMKPGKKRKDVDSFDKLVASYKKKILSSAKF